MKKQKISIIQFFRKSELYRLVFGTIWKAREYPSPGRIFLLCFYSFSICMVLLADAKAVERLILANLQSLYDARRFEELVEYGNDLLKNPDQLYREERIAVHSYLGFSYVILRRELEAKHHFIEWLKIEPEAQLDPVLVPPNIIRVFQLAKDARQKESASSLSTASNKQDRWLLMKPVISRSLIFPGWGHYYAGDKAKGMIIMGTETVLLIGCYLAHQNYLETQQDYYQERDIAQMTEKFRQYQYANRWQWSFITGAIIVYAGTQYDILNNEINFSVDDTSYHISLELLFTSQPTAGVGIFVQMK